MSPKKFFAIALVALYVAPLGAADKVQERFNAIRSYVARVDAAQFAALLTEEIGLVNGIFEIPLPDLRQRLVLDQTLRKLTAPPEFADRKIVVTIFRPKDARFTAEAISFGDNVFVSEAMLERLLGQPDGRVVLGAVLAHELSHGKRDFLVKRALVNDKVLSLAEKERLALEIEYEADRGAINLLQRVGEDLQGLLTLLTRTGERERLREAERSLTPAAGTRQQQ